MRTKLIAHAVCVVSLIGAASAQWPPYSQAADAPIKITLTGPTTAAVNSEIRLHIVLANTSTGETVGVPSENNAEDAEWNYTISVTDDKGNAAQETEYGIQAKKGPELISGSFRKIGPGQSMEEVFLLNKLFVLVPGQTYHVQVQHHHEEKGTTALTGKSNIFTIAITQSQQ